MAKYQNPTIKSLCKNIFSLDKENFAILNQFAIKGEIYRNQVITEQDPKTISKNVDKLFKKEFLILRKIQPYRGHPNKKTKLFGLSLKGYLASLRYCDVEDNYLTKKYLKPIKDKQFSKKILNYLKDDLAYSFKLASLQGITFDKIKYLANWFEYNSLNNDPTNNSQFYLSKNDEYDLLKYTEIKYKSEDIITPVLSNDLRLYDYVQNWWNTLEFYSIGWNYDRILHPKDLSKNKSIPKNFDYDTEYQKIDWGNLDIKARIEKKIELQDINFKIAYSSKPSKEEIKKSKK